MKRIAIAFVPVLFALPAAAQPPVLANLDHCATYSFTVDGKGERFAICRSGTRVWSENQVGLQTREIWDTTRAHMTTIYVRERKYTESDYHGVDAKRRDALRPHAVKRLALLTDPEIYLFERIGTETMEGRDAVKWRVTVRPGKEYLAFPKQGYAWTGEGGLLLRIEGDHDGKKIELKAVKVDFGTPSEDLFQVPRGYKRID